MHGQIVHVEDQAKDFVIQWSSPFRVGSFETSTTTTTGSQLRYAGYVETKGYVGSYPVFEYGDVK